MVDASSKAIILLYKKQINHSNLTFFTRLILNIDFHTLNIISICHLNEYISCT